MAILKERDAAAAADRRAAAGRAAEVRMAFYLRRAFGARDDVLVFNDLRLVEADDACQIDHLILHEGGGIIVESKSVTSKIRVNCRNEWARLWDGRWRGMASPVIQAQNQAEFLRRRLDANREELRGKLLGVKQKGFRNVDLAVLVAISDRGLITRERPELAPEAVKADQVPGRIAEIMRRQRKASGLGAIAFGKESDVRSGLEWDELMRIGVFLGAQHSPAPAAVQDAEPMPPAATERAPTTPDDQPPAAVCRHCGGADLRILWGRYGYYWKCACGGNTPIDTTAPDGSKGRVRKRGKEFFLTYANGRETLLHVDRQSTPAAGDQGPR